MIAALALAVALALAPAVTPPPGGADLDYQLGGASRPADNVEVVVRDRSAAPAGGRYNVCYVNGFQTQPDERRFWRKRWHLVLKRGGRPVVDEAWGEWLLDIRTPRKRVALTRIVGRWIDGCARDGFDAVELDNLDSFSRSRGLITRAEARAFARHLVRRAHRAGLAVGQKNWAELDGRRLGFDFAVAEECGRYAECGEYVATYGSRVLVVEYRRADFRKACDAYGDRLGIVLRDRALRRDGLRDWC
ncbi:endo alpha-1,4 polygalactosaminidase [Nocardioides sp. SYSU DS0651]|uniref:endo alpha-1,4 polygalactosaminidase n=1 Tax=Nocardioides sp. SYSU DS0651 TaxID=3415955 RepID=UPI003F4C2CE5